MNVVLFKLVLCLLLIGLVIFIHSIRNKYPKLLSGGTLVVAWLVLRVLPFGLVYLYLGYEPESDVSGFFARWGNHARQGELVYRDFVCTYSPFYPYLIGFSLVLWDNLRSVVFLMIVMEGFALIASYFFYKPLFSRQELISKLLLYLCMPASLSLCVLGAQEDVWTWLFVALAAGWGFYRKQNYILYGSLLVLGLLTTKATFVLIFPALLILARKPSRFFSVLAVWGLVVLVVLYSLVGLEFTQPLGEADTLRAPNMLSVLNPWSFNTIGVGQGFWNWVGLVITLAVSCAAAWRLRGAGFQEAVSRVFTVTYTTLMVVQQSAYGNYIFFSLLPLVIIIVDWQNRRQVALLLLFNLLCVVHPSYWWRLDMPKYLAPSDIWASPAFLLDYGMQVAIVVLTGYFVWLAAKGRPDSSRLA